MAACPKPHSNRSHASFYRQETGWLAGTVDRPMNIINSWPSSPNLKIIICVDKAGLVYLTFHPLFFLVAWQLASWQENTFHKPFSILNSKHYVFMNDSRSIAWTDTRALGHLTSPPPPSFGILLAWQSVRPLESAARGSKVCFSFLLEYFLIINKDGRVGHRLTVDPCGVQCSTHLMPQFECAWLQLVSSVTHTTIKA